MAASPRAVVKPAVLAWLRNASGLSPEETAHKLSTSVDNVVAWESGEKQPSMPQLRKLAKAYKRPISQFYLQAPVAEPSIPHDFRRLPEGDDERYSPALRHEIRMAFRRRSFALDLMHELGFGVTPVEAFGSISIRDNPEHVADQLRDMLGISYDVQSRWRDPRISYNNWRQRLEVLGVLVFQVTTVELRQMLGFSLAFRDLPVIAINRKNSMNGRTFTLIHECTHIFLGKSGICDIDDDLPREPREQRIEVFCNAVAGAALVPSKDLLVHPLVAPLASGRRDWEDIVLETLARDFGCSEHVVLRRLLTAELTTQDFYRRKSAEYLKRYDRAEREKKKEASQKKFGRNMAQETVSNLSTFAALVLDGYHSDRINLNEASRHLGIRAERLASVQQLVGERQARVATAKPLAG